MLKRLTLIFALTGSGYVLSVLVLKWMAQKALPGQMAAIGEFESFLQLVIGLVGFGMQSAAIRSIALHENWKEKLEEAQTARITFGILLAAAAVLGCIKNLYLFFLLAPLVAASADYALYARGAAIEGAMVAFVRVALPLVASAGAVFFWPDQLWSVYVAATVVVYFITNYLISFFLGSKIFYKPSLSSLQVYVKTIPLGILNLSFYFMGLGILLIAPVFFDDQELVISFLALKFYTIYKGVLRVIHQAFVNQMLNDKICLSVDQLGMMIGLGLLGSVLIFPNVFISLFFGSQYAANSTYFLWMVLAAVSFSVFNSLYTRLVLEHKEISFMKITLVTSGLTAASLVVLAYSGGSVNSIPISLFIGETALAISFAVGFMNFKTVVFRLQFFFYCSLSLVLPVLAKFFFGENHYTYFISFALMGVTLLAFTYKKFSLPDEATASRSTEIP
ncbi:MAG: hypothetical protein OJF59_001334 [Cytophagales bacterium]|jgi:hypothetical protein|nr:hypothetical protein [Bacteroidota bacterium]WHZ07581.1 MAG: hypothetical protein OJF59_001334 [Cytophagales bacterium]